MLQCGILLHRSIARADYTAENAARQPLNNLFCAYFFGSGLVILAAAPISNV
jgi:hypothetical protein